MDTIAVGAAVFLVSGLSALAFIRRRPYLGWFIPLLIGCSFVTTEAVKPPLGELGRHLAPQRVASDAFPSGHATIAMALLLGGVVAVPPLLRRAAAIVAIVLAAAIAMAIVAFGLHPPSDVLGGYLVSAAWAAFLIAFLRRESESGVKQQSSRVGTRRTGIVLATALGLSCIGSFVVAASLDPDFLHSLGRHQTFLVLATTLAMAATSIVGVILSLTDWSWADRRANP